ncbi:Fe-Mn family superoxide dismutase [Achromobacter spanius]|uniref:Fe-Mn family superoxide dismutase n=1 Tax=Achromobacter spanius TaxID=217203 RepID=UPI00320A29A0
MDVMPKPLPIDPERIPGLSGKLLRSHYDNNYLGAVSKLNLIRKRLESAGGQTVRGFALVGAKREELLAANSVFLHEAYFDALGGNGVIPQGGFSVALERDFGSVGNWHSEFKALAEAMGGGAGWAILAWSSREARLINHWAGDHTQLLAGSSLLLALDMYEHAYHLDFGARASAYVDAFLAQIRWDAVACAYARTMDAASTMLRILPSEAAAQKRAVVLDVRRRPVFELAHDRIPGAEWRDPSLVAQWQCEFDQAQDVIVYCVHGHEISQSIALVLRARGIHACYMAGGIEGWKHADLPVC